MYLRGSRVHQHVRLLQCLGLTCPLDLWVWVTSAWTNPNLDNTRGLRVEVHICLCHYTVQFSSHCASCDKTVVSYEPPKSWRYTPVVRLLWWRHYTEKMKSLLFGISVLLQPWPLSRGVSGEWPRYEQEKTHKRHLLLYWQEGLERGQRRFTSGSTGGCMCVMTTHTLLLTALKCTCRAAFFTLKHLLCFARYSSVMSQTRAG